MAKAMSDPKVTQHIGDGLQFMEKHKNEFDVIITDSSDPQGIFLHHYLYLTLFLYCGFDNFLFSA